MMGPARSRFLAQFPAHLPTSTPVRFRAIPPKSLFLYNLPVSLTCSARCARNHTYLHENKDLSGGRGRYYIKTQFLKRNAPARRARFDRHWQKRRPLSYFSELASLSSSCLALASGSAAAAASALAASMALRFSSARLARASARF